MEYNEWSRINDVGILLELEILQKRRILIFNKIYEIKICIIINY